ncbi:tetratricopeptide repeat protein, partial [Macrococcus caseolyticus]
LNPRHDRALLNLAISYTNEGYDAAASQILEKWIAAKYPDIAELVPGVPSPTREQLHDRVRKMFLTAAQRTPSQGMDPDVQVGLGVLCYREDDYEKAIDCFRSALSIRPNDASLWNRLGATLANASHSEEAIDAYYKALELRPSFVRARYNLAVSCINIGCYRESAENILGAISLHYAEDGDVIDFNRSNNLIDTLRRVFFAMDRRDLLAKLSPGAKLSDFRGDFKF